MINILSIILIAVSLSMDTFSLSFSYGIKKLSFKTVLLTSIFVGIFHFIMPLIGNYIGISLLLNSIFKPKLVLFFVFLILSIDMFLDFMSSSTKLRNLNFLGILLFSFSVSFDSFSVGLGINYLYDNIIFVITSFCIVSFCFTLLGFSLGKLLSNKIGKYSSLIGSILLFVYSIWVLTN